MKICSLLGFLVAAAINLHAQAFDKALETASADYQQRLTKAGEDLNQMRASILAEKAPLLEKLRTLENQVLAIEGETNRTDTRRNEIGDRRRKLLLDVEAVRRSSNYLVTVAHDGLKAAVDNLAPGEEQVSGLALKTQLQKTEDSAVSARISSAVDTAELLIAQTERALGGYRATGSATMADTSQVLAGTYVFLGPEVFFRGENGVAGTVRPREGAKYPVCYTLAQWDAHGAEALFAGQPGMYLADASGGKALRLRETSGTLWEHIQKGGVVAFAIIGVGMLAIVLIVQKARDLAKMGVDSPGQVRTVLDAVAKAAIPEAEKAVSALHRSTRELLSLGLTNVGQSKVILEERLEALLLEQRIHYERRLPLLAVIATAAPLMGLLGTVVGMVRTFALITVFGTGNAAKLSSGISEVLVATELGLTVAIPALVAHGFLAHRIQRNLSQLQSYAVKFCTAVETSKQVRPAQVKPDRVAV